MVIRYVSTRGRAPSLSFEDTVLAGLAEDGGLYVPDSLPRFEPHEIADMAGLSYADMAVRIVKPFVGDCIGEADLIRIAHSSYDCFHHSAVAPLKQLSSDIWVLELFHGPTLAFKDFALQFLGHVIDYILQRRGQRITILGATSGDTGSASIAGCRGRDNIDIFILFPDGKVSDVQRRQMTTVADKNVHCIAIDGHFDDCQNIVKKLFLDREFKERQNLTAVNSINWARIMAQIVYYFYAAISLGSPARRVSFSVPTGNFGDIYAGYLAARMGLPVANLIIASNRNDILTRCYNSARYCIDGVFPTISPSMDIQISSNFERLIFDIYGGVAAGSAATEAVNELMSSLRDKGEFSLSAEAYRVFQEGFAAYSMDDDATKAIIRRLYEDTGEVVDPHSAVGIGAAQSYISDERAVCRHREGEPIISLATAHPAKFPEAVKEACGVEPVLPSHVGELFDIEERYTRLPNDVDAVRRFIEG